VLIWDLGNFPGIVARNGLFASALRLRGERTHTILCDGTPVACIRRGIEQPDPPEAWDRACQGCAAAAKDAAQRYGLEYSWLGSYIPQTERDAFQKLTESLEVHDLLEHVHRGVEVGRIAWSSLNRHLKGTLVEPERLTAEQASIFRRYVYAALVNVNAAFAAMEAHGPRSVLASHGVYVDYAPAMAAALLRRIPAVSWSSAYADAHHYFTVPKGANQLLLQGVARGELWDVRARTPLTSDEECRLDAFLHRRYFRREARDIRIMADPGSVEELRARLGLRPGRRVVGVFAHVNWDACFDMSSMIFPNANVWTMQTIGHAIADESVDWVIRVHPGELTDGSVLSTGDLIRQTFPQLPPHVKVLWADSDINSYGLYRLIDVGVTIFGTVGVELTAMGKPVILAGQAHYGAKGFTHDAVTREHYLQLLAGASSLGPLDAHQTALARRYAYWYFVQRQIPIRAIDSSQGHWGDVDLSRLESLLPGHDPVLDAVCRNILGGEDFVLPTAVLGSTHA
jgi:hypothetical protein